MNASSNYWFRAKRYGIGWGLPLTWQGCVVLATYVVCVLIFSVRFTRGTPPSVFYSQVLIATVLLLVICWLKGEPLKWRTGGD